MKDTGIELRDWLAGQAVARCSAIDMNPVEAAKDAYATADAMMAVRDGGDTFSEPQEAESPFLDRPEEGEILFSETEEGVQG